MSGFAIAQLDDSIDSDRARTVAAIVAGSVALMHLYRVARPMSRLRLVLLIGMVVLFALAFLMPWSHDLFELPTTAAWAYALASAFVLTAWPLLEVGSRIAQRWHEPDRPLSETQVHERPMSRSRTSQRRRPGS